MGKKKQEARPFHKQSLQEQIIDPESNGVRTHPRAGSAGKRKRAEDEEEQLLDTKISGRILKEARAQQQEIDAEEFEEEREQSKAQIDSGALRAALQRAAEQPDSDDDVDTDDGGGAWRGADDMYDLGEDEAAQQLDVEDERALQAFMAPNAEGYSQPSLGDVILAKLREKQTQAGLRPLAGPNDDEGPSTVVPAGLDDKVVAVYRGVGRLLSRYTAGKVPKAFKIIPNLKNWEEVLYLTEPESWSVHAMYQATRLFVSNLNARLAQRFLALVLLPRIRWEIKTKQKLHFALFQALKKATYKPGAFYKGLLLPLCQSQSCTVREAVIFTSVLKRVSIPVLHSAAALLRLAQLEYCGTTSFFIRVLLDKKYALPYRVVDALVDHFVRFADDEREMPAVWHMTLLTFVQRYKHEVRPQDLEAIRKLCTVQSHPKITPEVLRELDHSKGARGSQQQQQQGGKAPQQGRAMGVAAMEVQSRVGANVVENTRDLPPVMIMEQD